MIHVLFEKQKDWNKVITSPIYVMVGLQLIMKAKEKLEVIPVTNI